MKKNINKILYFCILCFLCFSPLKVNAYLKSVTDSNKIIHKKEVDDRTYLLLCSYVHKNGKDSYSDHFERVNIYYTYNDKWLVSWDNISMDVHGNNYYRDKTGVANNVFGKKGDNIYISDEDKEKLIQNGQCPNLAWVDHSELLASNEICFGSESYCKSRSKGNIGTNFGGKNTSSKKNYDMSDEIKTWFKRNSPTINSCDDLRNLNFNIKEQLVKDILKSFLNTENTKVPPFFKNNPAYKEGLENISDDNLQKLKKQCDAEVNNDNSLSPEEKDKLLKKNQKGLDEALKQIDKFKEEVEKQEETIDIITDPIKCENVFNNKFGTLLKEVLNLIRFAVPIIILGLSVVDYIKAIAAQDAMEMKKASVKLGKRLIIGVIVFVLPTLINVLLELAGIEFGVCDIR